MAFSAHRCEVMEAISGVAQGNLLAPFHFCLLSEILAALREYMAAENKTPALVSACLDDKTMFVQGG
jgi:hypothetical protein